MPSMRRCRNRTPKSNTCEARSACAHLAFCACAFRITFRMFFCAVGAAQASTLSKMSQAFHRKARDAKRFQMWQQAKFGVAVGTAVTVGVALVVVPPLVAVL
mmetsp:Transcript_33158/g.63895  ORF Transcript_33158/g.63895 Transcript_33158/m.63895 type:complete len:102 (+) Transcript_33158:1087-1392(+)